MTATFSIGWTRAKMIREARSMDRSHMIPSSESPDSIEGGILRLIARGARKLALGNDGGYWFTPRGSLYSKRITNVFGESPKGRAFCVTITQCKRIQTGERSTIITRMWLE